VSYSTPGAAPVGLAYDAVSRRFVVADRATRKLSVVDEFSHHVATLAGAQAAFADISALEIDPRAGNLWVVSSEPGSSPTTTLHKLQLISGRVLSAYQVPGSFGAARFVDVAVTPQGGVLALDDERGRIFRLRGTSFDVVATLNARPSSLAPTDNGAAYIADSEGLVLVNLGSGGTVRVTPPKGASLSNIGRLRWHRGTLVGLQRDGEALKAVRLTLDRSGRSVRAIQSIDPSRSAADPTAAAIAGDILYYLATANAGEATVRKVRLN
jgi:DNA-binding beta-propeller fold protein YncE